MHVIGITGKICSGKNHISAYLADRGFQAIDVDRLGHEILAGEVASIVALFGDAVREGNAVDRKALAEIVFSDPEKLRLLEEFLHPLMVETCRTRIAEAAASDKRGIILNAAVLARMGLDELCDICLVVEAACWIRLLRAVRKRGMTVGSFIRRNRGQHDITVGSIRSGCRVIRVNNGSGAHNVQNSLDSIMDILDSIDKRASCKKVDFCKKS